MLIGGWLADRAVEGLLKISFYLDTVIYRLAGWSYKIFYIMGGVIVDSDSTAQAIVNKIYTILLIFMVFVVAYNMLLYIINPDKIQDGSAGAGNLVKKIAISLVVIVASPLFFDVLYDVQREIIDYNVIGNIILGDSYGNENVNARCDTIDVENSGDAIVSDIYTAFLYPVNGLEASNCCDDTFPTDDELRADPSMAKYCAGYINSRATGGISGFADVALSAINQDEDYQYLGVVSTAAGIIMAIYFLSFCVNLGIRLFKLLALELIAPIPALLDLLPGKSGTLENWFKTVMKVYAQVFIYQAIVFSLVWLATLVPGLLNQVFQSIEVDSSGTFNGFLLLARVLLIVALFQACKEVPKMLSEVLGIKGEGGILKAAGLKSLGSFGKKVGMGASFLGGAALSSVGNFARGITGAVREDGIGGLGRGVVSGLRGAAGGLARNAWGARNAKSFSDLRNARRTANQTVEARRANREAYRRSHGGTTRGVVTGRINDFGNNLTERAQNFLGMQDNFDNRLQNINRAYDIIDSAHIDDRAGRLGELHQQRDGIQAQLNGIGNRILTAQGHIDEANQFCNTFNEYRNLHDSEGSLSTDQQRRLRELDNQLFGGYDDHDARERELQTQFDQYSDEVSWEASQFIENMDREIREHGYTMSQNEQQQYASYREELANNELLSERRNLEEQSANLTAQYNAIDADYTEQENAQINRNETNIRQVAIQIQDLAGRDAELEGHLSGPLNNITLSDGAFLNNVNGLDFLAQCVDHEGNLNRDQNGNIVYTDNDGNQHNIELADLQHVVEGMRGNIRNARNDIQVQGTSRDVRRGNRGGNNDGGNNS